MIDDKEVKIRFTYHAPKEGQPVKYKDIRDAGRLMADLIVVSCPESRELALALTKIEEAIFWANASIARRE